MLAQAQRKQKMTEERGNGGGAEKVEISSELKNVLYNRPLCICVFVVPSHT